MASTILARGMTVLAVAWLATSMANAVERHAFVVGVDAYENVTPLQTARSDAKAVADALASHGFHTVTLLDPDRRTFSTKLSEFVGSVQTGDDVVLFFAGHGVAVAGTNFLLASDFPQLRPGQDGVLRDEAFSASEVIDRIKEAGARTTVAILDACRDNPLASIAGRSIGATRGLARMEPSQGSFVLYSADAGQAALDRLPTDSTESNSVFTRFLLPHLTKGTLTFPEIARAVRRDVYAAARTADHDQLPTYYDALLEDFRLAAVGEAAPEQSPPALEPRIEAPAAGSGQTLALLVGIDDYATLPDLRGTVSDARALEEALKSRGAITTVLIDGAASNRAVSDALTSLAERVAAGDTFVFGFSGHGHKADAAGKLWRLFLMDDTSDASPDQLTTARVAEVANGLAENGVNVILVIDAISDFRVVAPLLHPRVTAMFGHEDERPYPEVTIEGVRHGALSFSVARALAGEGDANSDGTLSQDELIAFVRRKVGELTGGKQKPGIKAGTPATAAILPR